MEREPIQTWEDDGGQLALNLGEEDDREPEQSEDNGEEAPQEKDQD